MGVRVVSRVLGAALVLLLACAASLRAQVATGTISGYVFDPSGKPIARAAVLASDALRGVTRETVTDETGLYRFADFAPVSYQISASAHGFETTRRAATLEVNARLGLDFRLVIAGITQQVEVTARVEPVQTESAELGGVIDQRRIQTLPLNPEKKASARELDKYGFSVGSKRSKAVALLATGKHTVAEALKLTDGYGLSKTLRALQERGFKLVKDAAGKCTITGSGK